MQTLSFDKTWFITGASSGIGKSLVEQLLGRGERVAATARRTDGLAELEATWGDRLWVAALDVTDAVAVRHVVDRAFDELGRIDVIVNNAGYGLVGAAEEVTDADIERQIATNLTGSIHVIRAALPHLRAQGGGRVLQVASEGGQVAYPHFSLYHASKWGIEGFVEAVAQETAPFNIEFTIVEPGAAKTGFSRAIVSAAALPAYDATPSGAMRRTIAAGTFPAPGDPTKMARAMIDSVDHSPAPKRLTLGSDAYAHIHAALTDRLAALGAQQAVALSTDVNPPSTRKRRDGGTSA